MGFFVGIGAQKAGTSWLAAYLEAHPQVFLAPGKEMHYFDAVYNPECCGIFHELKRQLLERFARLPDRRNPRQAAIMDCLESRLRMEHDEAEYAAYFRRSAGDAKAFGEITPSYSTLDLDGFQAIVRLFPEARFLFILRNPADRVWSQVRQRMRRLQLDFSMGLFRSMLVETPVVLRTDYGRTLSCLRQVVAPGRLLVLFYENLFGPDGEAQVRRVTDFLGIDYLPPDLGQVVNRGQDLPLDGELRAEVVRAFLPTYDFVRQQYVDIPQSWLADMAAVSPDGAGLPTERQRTGTQDAAQYPL